MKRSEITLTMTKKQLNYIIFTMGVALETDCKAMNNMSEKSLNKLVVMYEVLKSMEKQSK
jgi:hypothetical protein